MSPVDYFMFIDPVFSSALVGAGYGMLTYGDRKIGAIRVCFWLAAIGIGSDGVVWGVWGANDAQPLWMRLTVAGVTGAAAAVGLTWGLWHLRDHIAPASPVTIGQGGDGGSASVKGKNSGAEGGSGGQGGIDPGGKGGDAEVKGDNSFAKGGAGGNAGQPDGRGGRRSIGGIENPNNPTAIWKFGQGGLGQNAPEYDRRLQILIQIREDYFTSFPADAVFIRAGIDQVPIMWVNKRLEELNESWRVTMDESGYKMPNLKAP